jgi:uncharacterized membrane protein YedE/YeeE
MDSFTPLTSLAGGVIIGLAAAALLFFNGRILGISGIFGGLLHARHGDTLWRCVFLAGLLCGGLLLGYIAPQAIVTDLDLPIGMVIIAGLLVGIGARLSNGCTSGHGICGVGRLAPRSIVATLTFLCSGILTAVLCSALANH